MMTRSFQVDRRNLDVTRIVEHPEGEDLRLGPNQVLFRVERFGLAANNITYGLLGDTAGYWRFFPAAEPWGRIPVWGVGRVTTSNHPEVRPGDRYGGFYPMSDYLVVTAQGVRQGGMFDASEHRQPLPAAYNGYSLMSADNGFDTDRVDHDLAYRAAFSSAFALADFLEEHAFFGATSVLVSSASSKLAVGLACMLETARVNVVGLTSNSNKRFVERLGIYDQVLSYDELTSLNAGEASAFVDIAGNPRIRELVHRHIGDNLKYSGSVGRTHWDQPHNPDVSTLPGAPPSRFLAFTQAQKRVQNNGIAEYQESFLPSWRRFLARVDNWITIVSSRDMTSTYQSVLRGGKPDEAYVVDMNPQ